MLENKYPETYKFEGLAFMKKMFYVLDENTFYLLRKTHWKIHLKYNFVRKNKKAISIINIDKRENSTI